MSSKLVIQLYRYINTLISEIFLKNLYEFNLQYLNDLNLTIENYISFYYRGYVIIISIDITNQEILNTMKTILDLKTIKVYCEQQTIKHVFVINIDTKKFNNKENYSNIVELKLKISSFTLKNDKIYEMFISSDVYSQLIMIKDMIDNYE